MPKQHKQINRFDGLSNLLNPRDIGFGLSKAQNVSIDKRRMIRTIGGLEDFTKVDGVTALTQTAKIAPGSGLFQYGSDHWKGTDTIVDILSQLNAASDHDADSDGPNATTGWTQQLGTLSSVADTDGTTIASNGTSYILKLVIGTSDVTAYQTFTTVIGQRYFFSGDLYCKDATYITIRIGSTLNSSNLGQTEFYSTAAWANRHFEFIATTTTTYIGLRVLGTVGEIAYTDDIYVTAIARRDIDTNWLALLDAATAQIDIYNVISDSFTAGLLDFGTVSSFVGAAAGNVDFPTVNTITDSASTFLNQGVQAGDIRIVSGCSTTAANNILFVVDRVIAGTVYARGSPFTVTATEAGTVTLTKYNPTAFHYVNEALRASPVDGGIALRPKHYSFVDRIHFEGADASEREFSNWFLNDVGPVAPTDISAEADAGDQDASALTGGAGWEVGITTTADEGEWTAGTYVIACFFTYDDGQISALYVPSTDEEFGTTIVDGDSLTITVRGKNDYDERISGGGVCCRLDESDEPWSLLADISMAKGARATLSGTYNAWNESDSTGTGAVGVAYSTAFKSIKLNLDSYESLAGIDPTTTVETFSGDNAFWNASVIGGNRCFIFAPRYTDAGGNLQQFRDRIMYSQVNAYDTFPIDNIIDVVKGDAEDYVVGGIYGNDLLAFKSRTLYIIDISDPDPAGWQMKQDKNKGKYPRRGVAHPGAYFETPHGPAWCNEFGVFLYTGGEIVELLKDKIELSEHPLAYQRYYYLTTDDYISVADDANLDQGTNDFTIIWQGRLESLSSGFRVLAQKQNNTAQTADAGWSLFQRSSSPYIRFLFTDGSNVASSSSMATDYGDGEEHEFAVVVDRSTDFRVYVDGALVETLSTGVSSVGDISNAIPMEFGRGYGAGSGEFYLTGNQGKFHLWNRGLSATEVLAFSNGQPVLAADQWGAQTALYTSDFTADADGFVTNAGANLTLTGNIDVGGETDTLRCTAGADVAFQIAKSTGVWLTVGQYYRIVFDYYADASCGVAHLGIGAASNRMSNPVGGYDDVTVVEGSWQTSKVLTVNADHATRAFCGYTTATGGAGDLLLNGKNIYFKNITVQRIGCVAEYAPKNIGDATWLDESTNDLDGTVVGATAIYEDSWAKFWTNYSILGYHARTNQLIIMRDCTGKWSSGQDYGDVWIIDLDTGASTTGRRVFTKGIAYSNWATDWNQELIIAEQTSSTSVTIKQWTDEPQSQAAGLIDIRLADIDFGNPATNEQMNAFLATYKSSATQTNALSYALNGDDRQTAWIRLTGTLDPEGYWEELKIEPTDFNVKSIRLKLDNPTAAGTMEVNDLSIVHRELLESI